MISPMRVCVLAQKREEATASFASLLATLLQYQLYSDENIMSLCHITSRATALAILAEKNGIHLSSERNKNPIPLHLLVKEMSGEIYISTPITAMPFTLHEHCMLVY